VYWVSSPSLTFSIILFVYINVRSGYIEAGHHFDDCVSTSREDDT